MSTGKDEPGPEVELLRAVLLDQPVDLAAPPDRMTTVANRFRRTRRLRVAATAVPMALLAAVFLPHQLGPDRTTGVAAPPASPPRTDLQSLYGRLEVPVPPQWSRLTVPSQRDGTSSVAFLSTHALSTPEKACPGFQAGDWTDPACLPVSGRDLGALLAFQIEDDPAAAVKAGRHTAAQPIEVSPVCRSLSGTKMYKVQRSAGPQDPNAVLNAMACVGELTPQAHSQLLTILDKAFVASPS
ncbi:hypothetical protein [Streptomyces sp. NPDC047706]|uniref:hypothetical protein n=1 Tax=Streptomyces sp. NPDC047706 TaxID=3365486 RepID=UPI003721274D